MTTVIRQLGDFADELAALIDEKDDPAEWYVLKGENVGAYSVLAADAPEEIPDEELAPEDEPADPNIDGVVQIGHVGWAASAFEDDSRFVSECSGFGEGTVDRRLMNLLLVHESELTDEVLAAVDHGDVPTPDGGDA